MFKQPDFTVVREHEEFVWLHDRFVENEEYAGIIVSQLSEAELYFSYDLSLSLSLLPCRSHQLLPSQTSMNQGIN